MNEAKDPAAWAQMMADRYGLVVEQFVADAAAMTIEERAEFLVIFERLAFLEAIIN